MFYFVGHNEKKKKTYRKTKENIIIKIIKIHSQKGDNNIIDKAIFQNFNWWLNTILGLYLLYQLLNARK